MIPFPFQITIDPKVFWNVQLQNVTQWGYALELQTPRLKTAKSKTVLSQLGTY